ncbi:MAG TPA: alpha-amylase family glycosyl hydrolase, partial [Anaeromyxobacteraceae bacterium]|nr:alpha-amylase family glycosyl hydrolase [Anaeromyxobacteraceae bacterium]
GYIPPPIASNMLADFNATQNANQASTDGLNHPVIAASPDVIVDLVVNHTSDQHPWFREARSSPAAPRRGWYVWRADDPGWTQPWNPGQGTWYRAAGGWYYALFWSGMPDLDWRNPAVRAEMGRIATLWLSRGVDGFRLDAVRYLAEDGPGMQADRPDTHRYLKDFAATVRAARPDAALVGEAWADTFTISDYYGDTARVPGGDELPLLFDFPLASAIVNGVNDGSGEAVATTLAEVLRTYPEGAADAPFLTNHDQARIATQVGNRVEKLRVAAAILLTLPGAPFIYYGEEVGMQNGPGSADEWKRTPMAWDSTAGAGFTTGAPWMELAPGHEAANVAAETGDPASLLSRYRAFIRARHASLALRRGDLTLLEPGHKAVLAFTRRAPGEQVLVAHNLSGNTVTTAPLAADGTAAEPLQVDPGAIATAGPRGWTVVLPPRSTGVWRLTGGR